MGGSLSTAGNKEILVSRCDDGSAFPQLDKNNDYESTKSQDMSGNMSGDPPSVRRVQTFEERMWAKVRYVH